jgi:hypothetical protein
MTTISKVKFTSADDVGIAHGLLGWVSFAVNRTMRFQGIAVLRSKVGLVLSFPDRDPENGYKHQFLLSLRGDHVRWDVEYKVLKELGLHYDMRREEI